jgi:hypothetical protein
VLFRRASTGAAPRAASSSLTREASDVDNTAADDNCEIKSALETNLVTSRPLWSWLCAYHTATLCVDALTRMLDTEAFASAQIVRFITARDAAVASVRLLSSAAVRAAAAAAAAPRDDTTAMTASTAAAAKLGEATADVKRLTVAVSAATEEARSTALTHARVATHLPAALSVCVTLLRAKARHFRIARPYAALLDARRRMLLFDLRTRKQRLRDNNNSNDRRASSSSSTEAASPLLHRFAKGEAVALRAAVSAMTAASALARNFAATELELQCEAALVALCDRLDACTRSGGGNAVNSAGVETDAAAADAAVDCRDADVSAAALASALHTVAAVALGERLCIDFDRQPPLRHLADAQFSSSTVASATSPSSFGNLSLAMSYAGSIVEGVSGVCSEVGADVVRTDSLGFSVGADDGIHLLIRHPSDIDAAVTAAGAANVAGTDADADAGGGSGGDVGGGGGVVGGGGGGGGGGDKSASDLLYDSHVYQRHRPPTLSTLLISGVDTSSPASSLTSTPTATRPPLRGASSKSPRSWSSKPPLRPLASSSSTSSTERSPRTSSIGHFSLNSSSTLAASLSPLTAASSSDQTDAGRARAYDDDDFVVEEVS